MTPEEVGAMDSLQRDQLLSLGRVYSHAHLCRVDRHLDCSSALDLIITFYADDAGSCTIDVARLAKFLSRSESDIMAAYKHLEADGVITIKPQSSPSTVTSVLRNTAGSKSFR
jgi:hypothetical protein